MTDDELCRIERDAEYAARGRDTEVILALVAEVRRLRSLPSTAHYEAPCHKCGAAAGDPCYEECGE